MLTVQVGAGLVRNEELGAIGVRSRVCHGDHPPARVFQRVDDFVGELAVWGGVDGLATLARARGIAALDHKPLDVAVEEGAVVVPRGGQGQEVGGGPRHLLAVDLQLDVAQRGVQRHRLHSGVWM